MADVAEALPGTLRLLVTELIDGPGEQSYMLNRGDRGLLRSLETLSAAAASARPGGRASIASHVDHLRYGLSLFNRWRSGEANPFATANWSESWERQTVNDAQWAELRAALADEARRWRDAMTTLPPMGRVALTGVVGSVAHLAYHLGAIRQLDAALSGPPAAGAASCIDP
jgi:hypothetical protein